jgi:hypothetical protein
MNRKLTKEETEMTKKSIAKRTKDLKELEVELKYFEEYTSFNERWKDYLENKKLRQEKAKEDLMIQTLKGLKEQIRSEKKIIAIQKTQLNLGVEVKQPVGVN